MIKKAYLLIVFMILCFTNVFSQNNVRLHPTNSTLCYNTELYVWIAGQSFTPTSFLWSTGETTPTINATQSGLYTVTVTGFVGNSCHIRTYTKSRNYTVLNKPKVNLLTEAWVCKPGTVEMYADSGYSSYEWRDGNNNQFVNQLFNASGGQPRLDTLKVWYKASLNNLCEAYSDTVVLRGIRKPNGVGVFYCGKLDLNINDSVAAGLVLEYLYPIQYEMEFTNVNDFNDKVSYITNAGNRNAPLNLLQSNSTYFIRSRPIINNVTYCWGDTCTIGIISNLKTLNDYVNSDKPHLYRVFSINGLLLFEKNSLFFDKEWMLNFPNGLYVITISNKVESNRFLVKNINTDN